MKLDDILPSVEIQQGDIYVEGNGVLIWVHSTDIKLGSLQMLGMYGGVEIFSSTYDSVYFFRALSLVPIALLYKSIVLRYSASIHIMRADMVLDTNMVKHLNYQPNLEYIIHEHDTDIDEIDNNTVFIHASLDYESTQQPGVRVGNTLLADNWYAYDINKSATVPQSLLWNVVIKSAVPITGEKKSNLLWQSTLQSIEEFMRSKRMQVAKHNNAFLQLIFSSHEQLRNFIFDYHNFITFHSQEMGEDSFTATTVIAKLQRNTSMFSADIDTYYNFSSSEVIFNHCHTSMYDALILEKDYALLPSLESVTFDSWVVLLEKQEIYKKDVQMLAPMSVSIGEKKCFYCGMRNHETPECPTHLFPWDTSLLTIWDTVGEYPFNELVNLSHELESTFSEPIALQDVIELYSEDSPKGNFVKALFSIPLYTQLRVVPFMCSRKVYDQASYKRASRHSSQVQYFTKRIASQELQQVEYELFDLVRQNKDYRYYTFLGFISIEKGDYGRALTYWHEAEKLSYTPRLVAWHLHLQGRVYEVTGQFNNALAAYKKSLQLEPNAKEIRYRYIVTLIQMGRVETAMKLLEKHLQSTPTDFVKILFDMQAKQGYLEITRVLNRMLQDYAMRVEQIEKEIESDSKHISIWGHYDPVTFKTIYDNFYQYFERRTRKDFLTYSIILDKYAQYQESLHKNITQAMEYTMQRVERVFNKLFIIKEHLKTIPARSQLKDFSKELDANIASLEKIEKASLEHADYFEVVVKRLDDIESKITEMEQSIHFMQMIRDSSLFMVLFLRNFIIVEIVVMVLIVLGIPTLFYYASQSGILVGGMPDFGLQWSLQKNTMVVATGIVLILVGSSTLLQFRKRKREIVTQFIQSIKRA